MNDESLNAETPDVGNPDAGFFARRFSTAEEALAASEMILSQHGWDSEIVRRHRFTPVNVPCEL